MEEQFGAALRQKIAAANWLLQFDGRLKLSDGKMFPGVLITLHQIIRSSVPLMRRAQEASAVVGGSQGERLYEYLASHIDEEANHDEWLLDDLLVLGWDKNSVLKLPPSEEVMAIVGSQYYLIDHYDPVSFLGYIAALEGIPPLADEIRAQASELGVPHDALKTVLYHAEHDIDHSAELYEFISSLSLSDTQKSQLSLNALRTIAKLAILPVRPYFMSN